MSLENCPQCGEPYTIHTTGGCPRQRYAPELFPGAGAARIAQLEVEVVALRAKLGGSAHAAAPAPTCRNCGGVTGVRACNCDRAEAPSNTETIIEIDENGKVTRGPPLSSEIVRDPGL